MKEFDIKIWQNMQKSIVKKKEFFFYKINMSKTILNFGNNNIEKYKFYFSRNPIDIDKVNIENYYFVTSFPAANGILNTLLDINMLIKLYIMYKAFKNYWICKNVLIEFIIYRF